MKFTGRSHETKSYQFQLATTPTVLENSFLITLFPWGFTTWYHVGGLSTDLKNSWILSWNALSMLLPVTPKSVALQRYCPLSPAVSTFLLSTMVPCALQLLDVTQYSERKRSSMLRQQVISSFSRLQRTYLFGLGAPHQISAKCGQVRFLSSERVILTMENDVAKFSLDNHDANVVDKSKGKKMPKRLKLSRKAKLSELRLYRLKAKKKMTSPNPEVRIRYKLEKAKRKELWLIEKLRKIESPKAHEQVYDPESLTEEERFYLKRIGEKKKHYVPVGRRGVFGGVVLNMHLHWKNHETVKVVCSPCKPGQVQDYAEELARLSGGIIIDIKGHNTILFYRGKNYVQPKVMSPPETISKAKALERYKFEQSLEHTSQFIEKLEKELEEYHRYIERYKKVDQQ